MFQNKGENKSRLCYSLQNHYICIAKLLQKSEMWKDIVI